uniref:Pathogen-related protein, related n=1 Tax=Medicago truncatula TaxID=3880 RepID=Q2HSD5_MEDTR|nr:Pathogen-related protein, related [Medicago truncatula]
MSNMVAKDKYRSILHDEAENIHWRHGGPPTYGLVNQLFEEGRTKVWPEGSLEETVQNAIKSWEMELSHKIRLQDFKTIVPEKFKLFVNENFKPYKSNEETFESSHEVFKSAFPRGFAWEVIKVYTGPPEIAFKFRHWGFFEGPFKGHSPTGKMVQFFGLGTLKVDDALKVEEVEIYYDPAELLGGLLTSGDGTQISACPFSN